MKVLQVLPELNSGGVERGTLELAAHLVEQGHESLVLSGGGRLVEKLEANGSRHIQLPVGRKSLSTLFLIPRLKQLLKDEQPDILHLRSRVPAWLLWMLWKKLPADQRPRLVTTVHGFYSVNAWSRIMCVGERVICVSESIQKYVTDHYPETDPGKLRVVPRGVTASDYPYGYQPTEDWKNTFFDEFPELKGKRLITLPGRITRLKGHGDLIDIMSLISDLSDVHAVVVGGAHPRKADYLDEVHRRVSEAGLSEHFTFTGNRDDLREILAISSIVLSLTSQPESFGRTTVESLAMGIPVAGYPHGGVGEQLDVLFPDGRIDPMTPEQSVRVIRDLLVDSSEVKKDNPFTLERMLEGTMDVYRELLD